MENRLPFLQFSSLQEITGLHHVISTRAGGFSGLEYSSLNLGYHVDDDATMVTNNRHQLAVHAGYDAAHLVAAQQVHGARSHLVAVEDSGRGALDWESAIANTDALIVGTPQIPVMILVADCAPLLLVDPQQKVLAVVHAGWRGAVAGVARSTLERMQREFGASVADVKVGVGPCLCTDCFEIGEEVAEAAILVAPESVQRRTPKPHLDLRALLQQDLEQAGVLRRHIETLPHCPRCNNETLFSHRGQQGKAGRFGLVAWWE